MEMNWKRLGVRISSTLHAKQFLVFFAIVLAGIDFAASMLSSYLRHPQAFGDVFQDANTSMYSLIRWPSLTGLLVLGVTLVLIAWLRCGYIRSLVGSFRYRPSGAMQFLSMLGLLILTDLLYAGLEYLSNATSIGGALLSLLQLLAFMLLLYADYAVVISMVDPARAVWRSLEAIGGNPILSIAVVMVVALLQIVVQLAIDPMISGGLAGSAGVVVLRVVVFGVIAFFSDVVLVCAYVDDIERGVVPAARPARLNRVADDEAGGD